MSGDVIGIEPSRPPVAGPPGPAGPAASNLVTTTASGAIARAQALAPAGDDVVGTLGATEAGVAGLLGFAQAAAADGAPVSYYSEGLTPLFTALVAGQEYFVYSSTGIFPSGSIPAGSFYRSVGVAVNSTTILFKRGPVIRKPPGA